MTDYLELSPESFAEALSSLGTRRACFVWDVEQGSLRASHPALAGMAEQIARDERDFDRSGKNSVFAVTKQVLELAQTESVTPTEAANRLADEAMLEPHPIWGHRGKQIIDSLVADRWQALG